MRKDFPHKPPDDFSDFTDEEYVANIFLAGYCNIDSKGRFIGVRYLTGAHERLGRKMLAQVLRSKKGPPREFLNDLADFFDPESENPRKLIFRNRGRGHGNAPRDRAIASFVQKRVKYDGRKQNDVVEKEATRHFGLSREAVYRALARDKKRFPDQWSVTPDRASDATD
jgi:hypothetical protein